MYLQKEKLQHINTIAHEGKVVVFATDADGKISYTVKQDGFEDSYLNTPPDLRTGWENWQFLEFPDEKEDQSVVDKEKAELTYQNDTSKFIFRSRYKTQTETAVTPVQAISALGHIYIFRQSTSNTLLVDRFVLDGMTNKLNRKLEVRFKRSKQKHEPTKNMNKGVNGLVNIDSLDFRDANGNFFYEPTTELCLINNLQKGWFCVVLVPTIENDVYRWHIFAYNSQNQKVELTTIRASEEGLFNVQNYTIFEESNDALLPRTIPGIIKRTLDINGVTVTNGLSATKYDLQQEQQTQSGEKQLLKTATKLMLAIPTDKGTAAFSFAIAGDGTLAEIDTTPDPTIIRSFQREVLLPLNTLDEIKAIGDRTPPPQGIITRLAEGTAQENIEDLVKISTNGKATELANGDLVKITGTSDYEGLYRVQKIDTNTFEISRLIGKDIGFWEKQNQAEGGLIFDGMITAYQKTADGKLRVTCRNHGLENGDEVQITGTEDYNNTYPIQKIDDTNFVIERKWATGEAINVKWLSRKRGGVVFDGVDDYIELEHPLSIFSSSFTVSMWVKIPPNSDRGILLGDYQLPQAINVNFEVLGGKLRLFWDNTLDKVGSKDLRDNQWHFISFVRDKENKKVYAYIDGVVDINHTGEIPDKSAIIAHRIGRDNRQGETNFEGQIAELRIWKVARTAEDIKNSMYLQLTGKEVGLVGYWRLGGIAEGQVIDFYVNCNDGIVYGDTFVSAATLNRKLAGGTDAVKYSNPELFAVSERATYEESFEFKVNSPTAINLAYLDNADGKNLGTRIFNLSYWGKSSRSAEEVKIIDSKQIKQNKFEDLGKGWYRVSCTVTIPDRISLLRSFEIANITGNWESLEIRKHRIRLLSDTIAEAKYTDSVTLTPLADSQATLAAKRKELELKEIQEAALIQEKRDLETKLDKLKKLPKTKEEFNSLNEYLKNLTVAVNQLQKQYSDEKESPFNYYCYIIALGIGDNYYFTWDPNSYAAIFNGRQNNNFFQKWKFTPAGDGYYLINCPAVGDNYYFTWDQKRYRAIFGLQEDNNIIFQKWKFTPAGGGYYIINCPAVGDNYYFTWDQKRYRAIFGLQEDNNIIFQKWLLLSSGEAINNNIEVAYQAWKDKLEELKQKQKKLEELGKIVNADQTQQEKWAARLKEINEQLTKIQTELNTLNTDFLNGVKNTQQTPQTMPQVSKDSYGLVTYGALLSFVNPSSRLNAIETCEGNVQLTYFDTQGRMRQTNYDATADQRNSSFEQWIIDGERACLNLSSKNSIVNLNTSLELKPDYTIEAWFFYPLATTEEWNTLIKGANNDRHIIVKKGKQLGIFLEKTFYDSSFNMDSLSIGWHHLATVSQNDTTRFYIDGRKVGDIKTKALADAKEALSKAPKDSTVAQNAKDIEKASLKVTSNIYSIGNNNLFIDKLNGYEVMQFDGVNDYVDVSDFSQSNLPPNSSYTIEAWIKPAKSSSSKGGAIISQSNNPYPVGWSMLFLEANNTISIYHNRGNFDFSIAPSQIRERARNYQRLMEQMRDYELRVEQFDTQPSIRPPKPPEISNNVLTPWKLNGSQPIPLETYTHVAVTYDGSTVQLYINGQLAASGELKEPAMIMPRSAIIGASQNQEQVLENFFPGQIADLRIWTIYRTQTEIQANMSTRLTGKEANLLAYFPLNEIKIDGGIRKVVNLVSNNYSTVVEANIITDQSFPIAPLLRSEQFGKLSEVRVWEIALSDEEIAVNSKTLLSGNEPGLLAYYPMNEATGEIVRDNSGNSFHATVSGASWWGSTPSIGNLGNNLGNRVMKFDGVNDHIVLPEMNHNFSQGFTVEVWVWYDSFKNWSRIIDFGNGSPDENILLANEGTSNTLFLAIYQKSASQSIKAPGVLETGKWIHLAATIDSSGIAKLYKNGMEVQTGKTSLPNSVKRTKNYIGRSNWQNDSYFHGKLSEFCIWNKARTPEEIRWDMYKRLSGKEPNLVAYYPLDEISSSLKVLDLANSNHGTTNEVVVVEALPIGTDALVSNEYNAVTLENGRKVAMMRRFLAYPVPNGVTLLPDKRIETLELKWIGNAQFAPTLLGYIEGAPPVPSENFTVEYNNVDDYNSATSVELTMSEDVAFTWNRFQEIGKGIGGDLFLGGDKSTSTSSGIGVEVSETFIDVIQGLKGNFNYSYQYQNQSNITSSSSLSMTDKLELRGSYETEAKFPHLGKRFVPKNIGYALVVSALADVFVTRLARTGRTIGYQVQPVDGIPPDVNTITFLIDPAYTMNGSLDGMTGSSATTDRFFKHVPEMRSQYGSLYPASYYRLQEAYDLKRQIESEDKRRESYFYNFNVHQTDVNSLNQNIDKGDAVATIGVSREEDKPATNMTEEEKRQAKQEEFAAQQAEAKLQAKQQETAAQKKQAEIQSKITDQDKRLQAIDGFDVWQKRMEDIQIRAGKRNIINTYVWDGDGGLRTESQSFANTVEHTIGGSSTLNWGLGGIWSLNFRGAKAELNVQGSMNLTQTMSKTEARSKGFQLNVDLRNVEFRGITDFKDNPFLPGEKVDRYRFMSFYLEGSTQNFHDFFSYVVDPEWLRSNDEEARALRQAQAGKPNKAWRVLHRVTYVERPALMGFGRDVRKLRAAAEISENQHLLDKIAKLEESNRKLEEKLDKILDALKAQK